jgi:hypothetical protein
MHVNALSISSPRDCDNNAVINCGALTTTELRQRYGNKGVATIYNHFGITAKDISAVDNTAVAGLVHKNGNVTVAGKVVATNAITAGRKDISGSAKVTSDGVVFYKRAPSVSFRPSSLSAFVIMENGKFKYAILGACGNPVMATAVVTKSVPVTPPPVTETPPPVVDTPVSTQTPESEPTATLTTATPTTLPETGPGAVLIVGLLAIIGGYIFHITHRKIKHKRIAKRNITHHTRPPIKR